MDKPLMERVELAIDAFSRAEVPPVAEGLSIMVKPYFAFPEVQAGLFDGYMKASMGRTDGIIFARNAAAYHCGRTYDTLKWKPRERVTLDLRLTAKGELQVSKADKLVVVGTLPVDAAVHYQPESILECAPVANGKWRVVGERLDKKHPNDMVTFSRTMASLDNYPTSVGALECMGKAAPAASAS